MSDWELIDHNEATGLKKWMRYEEEGDQIQVAYDQDQKALQTILDRNKAGQNEAFDRRSDMWHVGHIPAVVIYEWLSKHGVNLYDPAHADGVQRLLNSSDYRYLKFRDVII